MPPTFQRICILGAGTMGRQIALLTAASGYLTCLYTRRPEALPDLPTRLAADLATWTSAPPLDNLTPRLTLTANLDLALHEADLVLECIPEQLPLKQALFADLDSRCPADVLLASNSSSLPIDRIIPGLAHPQRALNAHFYNQPWRRPILEIAGGSHTLPAHLERMTTFARSLGLVPIPVQKESTGFVYNRIWRSVKRECMRLVDEGIASFEDIDRSWMLVQGVPLGPFALMDQIGLDVICDIEQIYFAETGDPRDLPPRCLLDRLARGHLGVKTGQGFYTYPNPAFEHPGWLKNEFLLSSWDCDLSPNFTPQK